MQPYRAPGARPAVPTVGAARRPRTGSPRVRPTAPTRGLRLVREDTGPELVRGDPARAVSGAVSADLRARLDVLDGGKDLQPDIMGICQLLRLFGGVLYRAFEKDFPLPAETEPAVAGRIRALQLETFLAGSYRPCGLDA